MVIASYTMVVVIGPNHLSIENRSGGWPLATGHPLVRWLAHSLAARSLAARSLACSFAWSFVRLLVRSAARSFGCSLIGCSFVGCSRVWLLVCWLLTCLAARVFDYSCVWLLVLFAARSFAARPSGCTFVGLLDLPVAH